MVSASAVFDYVLKSSSSWPWLYLPRVFFNSSSSSLKLSFLMPSRESWSVPFTSGGGGVGSLCWLAAPGPWRVLNRVLAPPPYLEDAIVPLVVLSPVSTATAGRYDSGALAKLSADAGQCSKTIKAANVTNLQTNITQRVQNHDVAYCMSMKESIYSIFFPGKWQIAAYIHTCFTRHFLLKSLILQNEESCFKQISRLVNIILSLQ